MIPNDNDSVTGGIDISLYCNHAIDEVLLVLLWWLDDDNDNY